MFFATLRFMNKEHIAAFFATLKAANPQPVTELEYTSVFELLAAVLLSAQATDVSVNKATRSLFVVANTPAKMLALGLEGLEQHIKTIGLYRSKGKHLLQTCQMLLDQHGGQVPRTREALEALPGVGRKTANVVLNSAFGEPTMAVDTTFSAWATARAGAWQITTGSGAEAAQTGAVRLPGGRTPLVDIAWALCVQGAPARVRTMPSEYLLQKCPTKTNLECKIVAICCPHPHAPHSPVPDLAVR